MGKKKDKKERKRREREEAERRADTERLLAEARAEPVADADPAAEGVPVPDPAPDAPEPPTPPALTAPPAAPPVELPASGPFPGVTPPAVLRRAPARPIPGAPVGAAGMPVAVAARDVVSRLSGAALCYGEPVTVGERTVIPVGRVRARGGMGFGASPGSESEGPAGSSGSGPGSGGGGAGLLNASPLGYIEITDDGTCFRPIDGGRNSGAGTAVALLAGAAAGLVGAALAARRRPAPTGLRRFTQR